jgi:hypothetical protein
MMLLLSAAQRTQMSLLSLRLHYSSVAMTLWKNFLLALYGRSAAAVILRWRRGGETPLLKVIVPMPKVPPAIAKNESAASFETRIVNDA